jgi:thymidylate synthase
MKTYLNALQEVLHKGTVKEDRTGTGTISYFGMQQRYDLSESFPAVTTKKLAWKSVVSELLWFIEGSGDERRLAELLHGTRDAAKTTIWAGNATAPYWQDNAKFEGDLGRVYGVQWRQWRKYDERKDMGPAHLGGTRIATDRTEVDQLLDLIDGLKRDPHGRRHIISAWNPGELKAMALPPCHIFAQFYVTPQTGKARDKLSCQMYQRSCDMFLGVPFNIASYSLLTAMIAQVCDLEVGEFVHVLGDAHIYLNHVEQVNEQLTREPLPAPTLWLNPDIKDITKFTMDDIKLVDYESHGTIKAEMAV